MREEERRAGSIVRNGKEKRLWVVCRVWFGGVFVAMLVDALGRMLAIDESIGSS